MKKTLLSVFVLLVLSACQNDRDVSYAQYENGHKASKTSSNDPLCLIVEEPINLYGNPNNYPKSTKSGYYGFEQPSNKLSWFYLHAYPLIKSYINNKYNQGNNVSFGWELNSYTISNLGTEGVDYTISSNTVYSYDPQTNNQLYPGNTLSPQVSSYVIYRISSDIDRYVDYQLTYFGRTIKPIGVAFNYSTTMCGDYVGLYYTIFYSL